MPKFTLPVNCDVLALLELARGSGYGFEISKRVKARIGVAPPPGTFYMAVQRLVRKGHITAHAEKPPLRRGYKGRPRVFFVITAEGAREAQRLSDAIRRSLLPAAAPEPPKV